MSAHPLRRLAAMLYDALLCIAVLLFATAPFAPFIQDNRLHGVALFAHRAWLLCVWAGFFLFFWTRKGRTLGMQAWRLRIETLQGARPGWRDALARWLWAFVPWMPPYIAFSIAESLAAPGLRVAGFALLALGPLNYLLALFDPQRRALHERWLRTRIVKSEG